MDSKIKIKVSVFSVAFALGLNIAGVAPVLGVLSEVFKNQGSNSVQMLQTVPYFLLMVVSIIVGWLVTKISKKDLLLSGLLIVAFVGSAPFILSSFSFIMFSRLLVGLGFGIISPLNTAVISEFFEGNERAGMMGLHVAGMGIGALVINITGGIIGNIGYNYYFLIHLIAFLAAIIVLFQLPKTKPDSVNSSEKLELNRKVYELSITSFFHTIFITAFLTNIGIHVLNNINGNAGLTGIITAVNAGFALIIGLNFRRISSLLKSNTLPIAISLAAIGYFIISIFPNNLLVIFICSALCGASLSCFMAQASFMISTSVSNVSIALANGVFAMIGGLGGLLSPIVLNKIAEKVFGKASTNSVFLICAIGMTILSICTYIIVIVRQKEAQLV